MRDVAEIQDRESLRYVIRHELKDLGIKLPKSKDKKNLGNRQVRFGAEFDTQNMQKDP